MTEEPATSQPPRLSSERAAQITGKGTSTAEFWMGICAMGCGTAWMLTRMATGHDVPMDDAIKLIGAIYGIFTGSRTIIKGAAILKGK